MERIKRLFKSLSKTEVRYLKKYLGAFHNKGSNKALEMLKIIEKKPSITQDEISMVLYNDPKSKAFIMLKARVLEKMLETLSLSINFHNNPVFKDDPAAFGSIQIIKELTYAILMKKRGLQELSKEILEKCLKKTRELWLPEFQVQALVYLQNISTSEKEVLYYQKEINKAMAMYQVDLKGIATINEFRAYIADKQPKDSDFYISLETKLIDLREALDIQYSVRAHYYYLFLKRNLHEFNNEYTKSKQVLEEMIQLFESRKGLQSKNRMSVPHIQLSCLELSKSRFEIARKAALKAMKIAPTNTQNYIRALLYRLIACMYLGNKDEGNYLTAHLSELDCLSNNNHLLEITHYLTSCHEYLQENHTKAMNIYLQITGLFSDKDNWNIGLRIYEILMLIDMDKLDVASSKIETLRKHISRYEPEPRDKLIYRYLYLLDKHSFLFIEESLEQKEILRELNKINSWDPLNYEVIKFDVWVEAKKTHKPLGQLLKSRLSPAYLVNN